MPLSLLAVDSPRKQVLKLWRGRRHRHRHQSVQARDMHATEREVWQRVRGALEGREDANTPNEAIWRELQQVNGADGAWSKVVLWRVCMNEACKTLAML